MYILIVFLFYILVGLFVSKIFQLIAVCKKQKKKKVSLTMLVCRAYCFMTLSIHVYLEYISFIVLFNLCQYFKNLEILSVTFG